MAYIAAVLLMSFLDPIRALITLAGLFVSRKPWAILFAAGLSAVAVETFLTAMQITRVWGQGLLLGIVASLLQAGLLFLIVRAIRERRAGGGKKPITEH